MYKLYCDIPQLANTSSFLMNFRLFVDGSALIETTYRKLAFREQIILNFLKCFVTEHDGVLKHEISMNEFFLF